MTSTKSAEKSTAAPGSKDVARTEALVAEINANESPALTMFAAERLAIGRPGQLPVQPPRYNRDTVLTRDMDVLLGMTMKLGACTIVGGPIGIGKTTAIAESAKRLKAEAVYVNMFGTTNHEQQLQLIWRALTGTEPKGTGVQLQTQILDFLLIMEVLLVIDDCHRAHLTALQSILAIQDKMYSARGRGTPLVLCGNAVQAHLKKHMGELLSRATLGRDLKPMAGRPLAALVMSMEPRIAGTKVEDLINIDVHQFRGDLRRWRQFFEVLGLLRNEDTEPRPLTGDEAQTVLAMMPISTR